MRYLYKALFLPLVLLAYNAIAQYKYYQPDTSVKVFAYGREQTIAWGGGFNNPQFSQADLNHDGLDDLVVYEPYQGVATYINKGTAGNPDYRYAPEYAVNFPPVFSYMILKDYNCDHIPDLFHRGGSGYEVYKGYYNAYDQLCFTFYRDLYYDNDEWAGGSANAYCNPGDIPSIVDVDNDGDLDFISYNIIGGYMNYYKNMRVELNLPCDSIHIELKDRCWGKVYQGFFRTHVLPSVCDNSGLLKPTKTTHSGNTPCLFDWDMDGDYDYLDGNVSFNEMTFLKNGRLEFGKSIDTMISQDTMWQTGGKTIEIPMWPAAFNVDVDQDGKKDLLIAPNSPSSSENYKCIWYYKNFSTAGVPDWRFQSDSFFTDHTIDAGTASVPVLYDYNKDGKPDLFVGSDGYFQADGQLRSRISYYRNTSTVGHPSFTLESNDFLNINSYNFKGAIPAMGDIDSDGKADLIIGHTDGTLSYMKNMAATDAVQPDWEMTQLQLTDSSGTVISVDGNAAPFIYDMDKDGKKDLVIGNMYGYLIYYRNVSTVPGSIKLVLANAQLGGVLVDPLQNIVTYSTPFIGKVDSTGTDYLLLGSYSGNIYQYTGFQSGDTNATYTLVDSQYAFIDSAYNLYYHAGQACGAYTGHRSSVTAGDIDSSGNYYLIVGNVKGGLEMYKRKVYTAPPLAGVATAVAENSGILLYPNPAKDQLNVSWSGLAGKDVQVSVYSMAGQQLYTAVLPAAGNQAIVPLSSLPVGLYVCLVQSGTNRYYGKFTVVR